jgi:hypothetical protein
LPLSAFFLFVFCGSSRVLVVVVFSFCFFLCSFPFRGLAFPPFCFWCVFGIRFFCVCPWLVYFEFAFFLFLFAAFSFFFHAVGVASIVKAVALFIPATIAVDYCTHPCVSGDPLVTSLVSISLLVFVTLGSQPRTVVVVVSNTGLNL